MGDSMSTHHRTHTQIQRRPSNTKHVVAFFATPVAVFLTAYALWTTLKQQCAAFTAVECVPVGSTQLGGSDVALLATFLAAGLAAIIEVATN